MEIIIKLNLCRIIPQTNQGSSVFLLESVRFCICGRDWQWEARLEWSKVESEPCETFGNVFFTLIFQLYHNICLSEQFIYCISIIPFYPGSMAVCDKSEGYNTMTDMEAHKWLSFSWGFWHNVKDIPKQNFKICWTLHINSQLSLWGWDTQRIARQSFIY